LFLKKANNRNKEGNIAKTLVSDPPMTTPNPLGEVAFTAVKRMTRVQKNLKLNAKSFIGAKFGVDSFAAYAYSCRIFPLEF